jgi:hypothetical protein
VVAGGNPLPRPTEKVEGTSGKWVILVELVQDVAHPLRCHFIPFLFKKAEKGEGGTVVLTETGGVNF